MPGEIARCLVSFVNLLIWALSLLVFAFEHPAEHPSLLLFLLVVFASFLWRRVFLERVKAHTGLKLVGINSLESSRMD